MADELNGTPAPTEPASPAEPTADAPTPEPRDTSPSPETPGHDDTKPLKVPDRLKPTAHDKDRFKGRIADLVSHRKRVEEENRQLREQLAERQATPSRRERGGPASDREPNVDEFDSYKDYVRALVAWENHQASAATAKQQQEQYAEQYRDQKRQEFEQHAAPILAEVPEFWSVISDESLPISEAMSDAVMELGEMGPYTMLWLAANRQEARKLYRLPPRAATVAMGRLALQLEQELRQGDAGSSGQSAQPTQDAGGRASVSPKLVPQIRGGSPGNMDTNPNDKMSIRDWMQAEAERMRKKAGNPHLRVYVPR